MASTTDVSSGTAHAKVDKIPRCRLLELPEELQLGIYELVVVSDKTIRLNRIDCHGYGDNMHRGPDAYPEIMPQLRRERMQPAITRACRKTRNISLPAYYKRNAFQACCCEFYGEAYNFGD
ncbi:hypothetical protein LTR97_003835 [Elasticomyces elasticus]|uniref:Uncharacterized protein n=1 Tax=Elasticomyces elasticus TaxID=574655 RepID=A0AAN7ZUU5_9PEZI|nr:hypothetical protein LTR97_003835 [Elasticomyces elasticus]